MDKVPKPPKPSNPRMLDLRDIAKPAQTTKVKTASPPKQTVARQLPKPRKKRRWPKIVLTILFVLLFIGGLYMMTILLYPKFSKPSEKSVQQRAENITDNRNKLFIPSVGIESEIKEGGIDILDQGVVWHRFPERGNPQKGGNFILTGHSFVWGYTPQEVTKQSVFYHLAEASIGDDIIIHWDGKIYKYKITGKETVKPDQTEVEKMSDKPKLTIYTCTTGGASDGRVVITAEPIN